MNEINILVNGEKLSIKTEATISDLVKQLDLDIAKVAVEKNLKIIDVSLFDSHKIFENDKIEIVHFIGGG